MAMVKMKLFLPKRDSLNLYPNQQSPSHGMFPSQNWRISLISRKYFRFDSTNI